MLDEREFELINIIGPKLGLNQRDLSREMNLSLGMINMLIRRLVSKGYIRIEQLNKKKVQYLLTPKGFAEKMRKSVKYALKTINSIGLIRESLNKIVIGLQKEDHQKFYILGDSDLTILLELAFQKYYQGDYDVKMIRELPQEKLDGVLLICKEGYENSVTGATKTINLLEALVQDNSFV